MKPKLSKKFFYVVKLNEERHNLFIYERSAVRSTECHLVFNSNWHNLECDVRKYELYFDQTVLRVIHLRDHFVVEKINLSQIVHFVGVGYLRIPLHNWQRLCIFFFLGLKWTIFSNGSVWQIL